MQVQDAVAVLIGCKAEDVKGMSKTADETRLEVEGVKMGLKQEMPITDSALLRVGRHLWLVNWTGTDGKAEQLTTPGT
jgi:hypothetical protein